MTTVELFAGIGGFRLAADSVSLQTRWANDNSSNAGKVYRAHFGEASFQEGNILDCLGAIPNHDLLTAGFPCQPFSSAGKKRGVRDPRGTLFQTVVDVLKSKQPTYFILENVKRLLTMENGMHFATILSSLAGLDYQIEWRLLNAMNFGLPQNRQRVFIIGTRRCGPDSQRIRLAASGDFSDTGLTDSWKSIEDHDAKFSTWGLASAGKFIGAELERFSEASALVPVHTVLQKTVSADFDFTESTLRWLSKNTPVNKFIQGVEILAIREAEPEWVTPFLERTE